MIYTYYRQVGNTIQIRYKQDGESTTQSKTITTYEPTLWVESDKPTETKSIYGHYLKPIHFDGIKGAKAFGYQHKDVDNFIIEGNSNYANQFVIELFDGQEPSFNPDLIRVGVIDIEVHAPEFPTAGQAKWPITAITVYDTVDDDFVTFGLEKDGRKYDPSKRPKQIRDIDLSYYGFNEEIDLLRSFAQFMQQRAFDATSGWNSQAFDMPYIVNRMYKILGQKYTKKMLSPFGRIEMRDTIGKYGKVQLKADIYGLPHLDYMLLYQKHIYTPRESYKLDFIAHEELDERKLSYEEAGSLHNLYETDYQLYIDYNVQDVNIIKRLDRKLGLFSLTYTLAYYTLSNYEDTLKTVRIWEQLVAKFLYTQGGVPLFSRKGDQKEEEYDGAFVKVPNPGFYEWVVSYDLNSLYPHIEMQYNIGPETHIPADELPDELRALKAKYTLDDLVEGKIDTSVLKKYDVAMAGNFEFYRRDQESFFSQIKSDLYNKRKAYKRKMLDAEQKQIDDPDNKASHEVEEAINNNLQMACKILLNSGYGALGNDSFLYFKVENAAAITSSGQLVNKWTYKRVNELLDQLAGTTNTDRCVAGDTDSNYFTIADLVPQLFSEHDDIQAKVDRVDQFSKEIIEPEIKKITESLADFVNARQNKMVWGREVIAERAVWIAKKNYFMSIWDSEGVRFKGEPKIKVMGVAAVKSSTPEWSRKLLKECYKIALLESEEALHEHLEGVHERFLALSPSDIAIPRTVNNIEKYEDPDSVYVKGTPKHIKAALIHNRMIDMLGLKHVKKIASGDKIKFVMLKKPNPTGQEVIGFEGFLPHELDLEEYVDYGAIYDTAFRSPLHIMLDAVKWTEEPVVSLF